MKCRCDHRSCTCKFYHLQILARKKKNKNKNRNKTKQFRASTGSTNSPCLSAAVLFQLSYKDPYVVHRPIYRVHLWHELREYRWTGDVISQLHLQFKQLQILARKKKKKFRASPGFEPMASALALQLALRWRWAMKAHILGADQLNWITV